MSACYYNAESRASAARARPAARRLARTMGVTIEEAFDGGWHEIRLLAPAGQAFDDLHELIIANAAAMTDGLWERALTDLTLHSTGLLRPCATPECEWCAETAAELALAAGQEPA